MANHATTILNGRPDYDKRQGTCQKCGGEKNVTRWLGESQDSTTPEERAGPKFQFIQDATLKRELQKDWEEVERVRTVWAWKSCVVLCGAIAEGMLFEILGHDEQRAKAEYGRRSRPVPPLEQWDLNAMISIAAIIGNLPRPAVRLLETLRELRNHIHPAKQVNAQYQLTEEDANTARNIVLKCEQVLSSSVSTGARHG